MYIMYNRFIHIFVHSSMVKRSSSKRAYKKRGTVRKSRVIRRCKTTQSKRKAQRGGMILNKLGEWGGSLKRRGAQLFESSSTQSTDKGIEQPVPLAPENMDANPIKQQAAAAEENKAALKNANNEADTAYNAAKQKRDEEKMNFGIKSERAKKAQGAASAAYENAMNAARAAKEGGVPETEVKYPKT